MRTLERWYDIRVIFKDEGAYRYLCVRCSAYSSVCKSVYRQALILIFISRLNKGGEALLLQDRRSV